MTLFSTDVVVQTEFFEGNPMDPDEEGYSHVRYYDEAADGLWDVGTIQYARSLLPQDGRDSVTDFEGTVTWRDSPRGVPTAVGARRSVVELRADYVGIDDRDDAALFILRDPGSGDYDERRGTLDLWLPALPDGTSVDVLAQSKEIRSATGSEDVPHAWPTGEPYDSNYVTLSFEHAPERLRELS